MGLFRKKHLLEIVGFFKFVGEIQQVVRKRSQKTNLQFCITLQEIVGIW